MRYIQCSIDSYLNNTRDPDALYFVSTNNAFKAGSENKTAAPCLIFLGDTLVSNSGLLVRHATNGIIYLENSTLGHLVEVDYDDDSNRINIIKLNNNIIPGTVTIKVYSDDSRSNLLYTFKDDTSNPGTGPAEGRAYIVNTDANGDLISDVKVGYLSYEDGVISFDTATEINSTLLSNIDGDLLSTIEIIYNNQIYIINSDVLSKNIPGICGQTLFVIDEFKDSDGLTSTSTYMYFWEQPGDRDSGYWKNANINYVNRMTFGDREISNVELGRLLALLY